MTILVSDARIRLFLPDAKEETGGSSRAYTSSDVRLIVSQNHY